ncbi:UbiX family flavin prenyltransferase [Orientia tsutsugamushi]|uniref:Flavin prenyltransferase UbiX n=4 Tax=Orientia tsutsugamushi TaxID=784 RepID=A0A0F3MAZ7_ORITS|nr:UbiX family flavin prenyltransferase [Orientia tsutsugamushi]KJV70052.1 polyprenyl P-hydroxybenzoate and phenylacrylic acid decarboxylase family protein [Orientia tsutsugamushi str. UT76]KJV52632.1 polyprenyl P-hydroxybenzoate and phenylacrylic acid decarboxylase family protein [Orientia tsutsugamushi str. Gilliam]KJV56048.1 polyprenyl P-hydroxybenzoate and phenylacrylic acid decarboxylase family protein [Orientia tsutsugamushi str. Karp]KJV77600.1 polyprenyl P-hydroxybenzoate and phenylacry
MYKQNNIVVAITGASGAIFGIKALELLKNHGIATHLIISKAAALTISIETKFTIKDVIKLSTFYYKNSDIAAAISSGSFKTCGMIVAPCSAKTLTSIAQGYEDNLIVRAASVNLKERRRLVLMFRESPYHITHLENMSKVTNIGGIIVPPVPAFYNKPADIEDIIEYSVGRALDLFDLDINLNRWKS